MPKSVVISQRASRQLFEAVLPLILHSLAKQKILKPEHLESEAELLKVLRKHSKKGTKKMEWGVAIEQEFILQAIKNWKRDNKFVAIVLYAAAVEQYVNQIYALMLRAHGLENSEIEKIVRTLNVEPKLSWLLKLVAQKKFPKALAKRIRTVFELRNAIVHFKGISAHPDTNEDSYSKIDKELGKIRRLSMSRDFRLLTQFLWKIALEKDRDLELAIKATSKILSLKRNG